jgi:ribosomal protein S12 methylthiotransferase accessory factor
MGITSLGDITGLDRIGIPVAVAVRPNSRSVSVAQGKGLDLQQALASALMEACEGYHAEEIGPCRHAAYSALAANEPVVDPTTLCPGARQFDGDRTIAWTKGFDLLRREPCWIPAEIVHMDYTPAQPDGYFLAGSNGLASGNHPIEAVNAALYEVVERDAVALWAARPIRDRAGCVLDLASVDDTDCRTLLDKYETAEIAVRVCDVTTDIGIPAFLCEIRDLAPSDPTRLSRFHGAGCHADRGIALARALTEAAQSRLTYIAGLRDDLSPAEYRDDLSPAEIRKWPRRARASDVYDALFDALASAAVPVVFHGVPSFAADDLRSDLLWALGRLGAAGLARAVAVDLTRVQFGVPVVRQIVPGLEWDPHHPNYRPGRRARAQAP